MADWMDGLALLISTRSCFIMLQTSCISYPCCCRLTGCHCILVFGFEIMCVGGSRYIWYAPNSQQCQMQMSNPILTLQLNIKRRHPGFLQLPRRSSIVYCRAGGDQSRCWFILLHMHYSPRSTKTCAINFRLMSERCCEDTADQQPFTDNY